MHGFVHRHNNRLIKAEIYLAISSFFWEHVVYNICFIVPGGQLCIFACRHAGKKIRGIGYVFEKKTWNSQFGVVFEVIISAFDFVFCLNGCGLFDYYFYFAIGYFWGKIFYVNLLEISWDYSKFSDIFALFGSSPLYQLCKAICCVFVNYSTGVLFLVVG